LIKDGDLIDIIGLLIILIYATYRLIRTFKKEYTEIIAYTKD